MTLEELGATLRAEREKRGLSKEDVAAELKISPRQLRALEDGDVGALPHPAYVRGFIRSYASWLGMGNEEIHSALGNLSCEKKPKEKEPEQRQDICMPEPAPRKHGKGIVWLLLLCLTGGGAYYAWKAGAWEFVQREFIASPKMEDRFQSADKFMEERDKAEALKAGVQNTPSGETASRALPEAAPEPAAREEEPSEPGTRLPLPGNDSKTVLAPIAGAGGNPAERAAAGMEAARGNAPEQAEVVKEQEERAETPAPQGPHKLVITATEECWVHSNADKTDTRQFSLRKGDTFVLAFSRSLELKLGNAGGVRLRYDGVDMPPPGTSGQVRTLAFPPPAAP